MKTEAYIVADPDLNATASTADLEAFKAWEERFNQADLRFLDSIADCIDSEVLSERKQNSAWDQLRSASSELRKEAISGNSVIWQITHAFVINAVREGIKELDQLLAEIWGSSWPAVKESSLEPISAAKKVIRRHSDRLSRAIDQVLMMQFMRQSASETGDVVTDSKRDSDFARPQVSANSTKLFPKGLPRNQDIIDLVILLNTNRDSGKSANLIAREFTKEKAGSDQKAKSLISQIRRLRTQGRVAY